MVTFTQIDTSKVTADQIGACSKFFEGSKGAYNVESESDSWKEYTVRFSAEHGFTCTCKSGEVGFSNTKDGYCKHVRWAVACEKEVRAAVAALEAVSEVVEVEEAANLPTLTVDGKPADCETLARVFTAQARKSSAKPQSSKAFSILK